MSSNQQYVYSTYGQDRQCL